MLLFGEKPGKFLNEFSKEFHRDFMDILKRCHGTKRIFANAVYQGKGPSIHYVINFRRGGGDDGKGLKIRFCFVFLHFQKPL